MTAMKFTYRSGQRPLDGFTIKRGVGQGGFGEVYFAVSDAGKEVALKLLHRAPDAELRGIAHWLNRYPTGLPVNLAAEWFAALCRGVGYLHDQGVVHRDLKPANVFIEN